MDYWERVNQDSISTFLVAFGSFGAMKASRAYASDILCNETSDKPRNNPNVLGA